MAKSYATIQKMIAKLQNEAALARSKEISEVIGRIKVAVDHFGLTPHDIFGKAGAKPATPKTDVAASATETQPDKKREPAKGKAKAKQKAAKRAGVPRYADGSGRTWTGNGQRPGWFKDALAGGKTADDLLIKS